MNPYYDQNFFSFFKVLFSRIPALFLGEELQSDEIQIIVLSLVALSGALIGAFLVLKRMTMIANSLSHTLLIGIAFVFWFSFHFGSEVSMKALMIASLVMAFITVGLTKFLINILNLKEDAATGLVFTSLFSIGIIFVTLLTRSGHVGMESVVGNVDALIQADIQPVLIVSLLNIAIFTFLFKEFKLTSFDPLYARFLGFSPLFFDSIILALTALTLISSFRAVGVIMVLCFLTAPVLSARFFFKKLYSLILYAIFLGVSTSIISVALSRHLLSEFNLAISTSGLTVLFLTVVFFIHSQWFLYCRSFRKKLPQ